jgi:hypothetical protein
VLTVAALYVDTKRGPYPGLAGVDCWGVERDATRYDGPNPVVAHPPCGHWGRYHQKAHDDGSTGPVAVDQVRRFGGVLEHPRDSKLWRLCGMPRPGEARDAFGGWTIEVRQVDWGHVAEKRTWLYVVGRDDTPPMPPHQPAPPPPPLLRTGRRIRGWVEMMPKTKRHLTPPAFAAWLVELARGCRR